jgi:hypothetical protein
MITIALDSSGLKQLQRQVSHIAARLPQVEARALNQVGDKVRTQVRHALQKQAGLVKYQSVTSRTRSARATEGALQYRIFVSPKATKAAEFKSAVQRGPGGGVTLNLWGTPLKFARSFEIASGTLAGAIKARTGQPRFPIRGFYGPNLAKEAVKDESKAAFFDTVAEVGAPILEKALMKALGGE